MICYILRFLTCHNLDCNLAKGAERTSKHIGGRYSNLKLCPVAAGSVALEDALACVLKLLGIPDFAQASANPSGVRLNTGVTSCSFTCLATILKGACMAGHKAALPLVALPLSYLEGCQGQACISGTTPTEAQPAEDASLLASAGSTPASTLRQAALAPSSPAGDGSCQAAAAAFELVPSTREGVLSLSKDMAHVIVKPLWQQRFYTAALQQLERLLTRSESAASPSPEMQPSQAHGQRSRLLLALAYLLKGTPAKISKADLPRLLRWLLMALELVQQPGLHADKSVMAHLLELVRTIIQDATGRLSATWSDVNFEHAMH